MRILSSPLQSSVSPVASSSVSVAFASSVFQRVSLFSATRRSRWTRRLSVSAIEEKEKVVVIMGATGSGKSRLSVDLATRFFNAAEVINSDKIQVYRGLEITTNKITMRERKGVKHHLIGEFDSSESHPEFTPSDFRSAAAARISDIAARGGVPFLVGGSNSFIYALLAKNFDPFSGSGSDPVIDPELRYDCCFLWVDVSPPVLRRYLYKRVDDMIDSGMVEELRRWFSDPKNQQSKSGISKAIGVPEFLRFFQIDELSVAGDEIAAVYEAAVREIKENTWRLAERQVGKIERLGRGWELHRVDATAVFAAAMESETAVGGGGEIWGREVVQRSMKIVEKFLLE